MADQRKPVPRISKATLHRPFLIDDESNFDQIVAIEIMDPASKAMVEKTGSADVTFVTVPGISENELVTYCRKF